jgi:hypothetical protein
MAAEMLAGETVTSDAEALAREAAKSAGAATGMGLGGQSSGAGRRR